MRNCLNILFRLFFSLLISLSLQLFGQEKDPVLQDNQSDSSKVNVADSLHYTLDEVVITGTRSYKKLIDIPYAVQRIDNRSYRFNRTIGVNHVMGAIPGLFLQSRYGNHDVRISIRGFGSRSNSGIRGVRILLDGIPESEPDGQTRIEAIDFNSIGTIEIVKGNASSLYTNAPGGVINFINDITFPKSFVVNFNEFGSYNLRRNGFKAGIRNNDYTFLLSYGYHNYRGYRAHGEDYWHIINTVLEAKPNPNSQLQVLGYFVDGRIRLPGSLTREQFDTDPFQANSRDADRDSKRLSKKGRVGLRFNSAWGSNRENEIELTTYGTIKYFERASGSFRVINRFGLGATARYIRKYSLGERRNELSIGTDWQFQDGPIEFYQNIAGQRGDDLDQLQNKSIGNVGVYFQHTFNVLPNRMDFLFTGRYEKVNHDLDDQLFAVRNASRRFEAFTPKIALNYKLNPHVALYGSAGRSFESPAANELDNFPISSDPFVLLNPDLKPQKSTHYELGLKGNLLYRGTTFFNNIYFEVTAFHNSIRDEIVPFELFGEVFFRNSAKTRRNGIEVGANIELLPGVRWETAYTGSDFSYDNYTTLTGEFNEQGDPVEADFSGNRVPSVPSHHLFSSLSYEHHFNRQLTGFGKVSYRSVSAMYVDDANSDQAESYRLLDVTSGMDIKLGEFNLLLAAGVNNIFDRTHAAFVNINSLRGEFFELGEPRNYYASIRLGYTFD